MFGIRIFKSFGLHAPNQAIPSRAAISTFFPQLPLAWLISATLARRLSTALGRQPEDELS